MLFIEVNPRKYKAVQFNKIGDVTGVSRGYIQTKPSGTYYYVSETCPRAMDCKFAYIVQTHNGLEEVKEGDWILTDSKNGKVKIVSNKKFLKDYVGYHEPVGKGQPEPYIDQLTIVT
jgi:hypothetical protein